MGRLEALRDLVQFVSQVLVEHPDEVDLREDDDGLLLVVADDDLDRVVGRRGKTARALRTVIEACGGRDLEITSREELENGDAEGSSADAADED